MWYNLQMRVFTFSELFYPKLNDPNEETLLSNQSPREGKVSLMFMGILARVLFTILSVSVI